MPPAGFEPATPATERPQTHALDRAATGIGLNTIRDKKHNILIENLKTNNLVGLTDVNDWLV
jgi:hypothetical protein